MSCGSVDVAIIDTLILPMAVGSWQLAVYRLIYDSNQFSPMSAVHREQAEGAEDGGGAEEREEKRPLLPILDIRSS